MDYIVNPITGDVMPLEGALLVRNFSADLHATDGDGVVVTVDGWRCLAEQSGRRRLAFVIDATAAVVRQFCSPGSWSPTSSPTRRTN